ncbi:UpxY family transcription antiterminator [Aquimarina pacifica]|uniref:UpxY family transcription antiterminator n=1 Tax=Aquimarina pacifica TaxID=1296415 RepID=UPI0004718D94|nr:UpxY family transcription antiterminator [Aquimarina pacifica]
MKLNTFKNGWYVLYVRSCQEKKVHNLLQENQCESFLPLIETTRQWSDRRKVLHKPLFPCYVFVKNNSAKDFYKALNIEGACTYIRFGKEYAQIADEEINRIKLLLNADGVKDLEINSKEPFIGEKYKINHGPLNGLDCEVVRINSENRVMVRFDSIRQNITATISKHLLEEYTVAV